MVHSLPTVEPPWTGHRLRKPGGDFAILSEPPLPAAIAAAGENHAALTPLEIKLQGRTVGQLRQWTREEALRAARGYTAELLRGSTLADDPTQPEPSAPTGSELLFVAGHQPALFHPGVWVKNFAIHEMASRSGGISLNLSVDTDVMGSTRIRVPTGGRSAPRIERVAFDADRPRSPWEENEILDRELFESFDRRVEDVLQDVAGHAALARLLADRGRRLPAVFADLRLPDCRSGSDRAPVGGREPRAADEPAVRARSVSVVRGAHPGPSAAFR